MEKYKNIFITILSLFIIFSCILQCTFISYASSHGGGGSSDHEALTEEEKKALRQDFLNDAMDGFVRYGSYILSLIGALSDSDFSTFLSNYKTYKDYVMNDWKDIEINDDGEIIIPSDLIAIIKQALKEYAEETNGFMICPTIHFSTISPSSFGSSYQYQTAKALVNEYGLVGLSYMYNIMGVYSFSEYLNNTAGFYVNTEYSNSYYVFHEDFLKWSYIDYPDNKIEMNNKFEKVIHTWDEAKSSASPSDGLYYYSAADKHAMYGTIMIYKPGYNVYGNGSNCKLVSKDGRNVLVFKNKAALENYTVDHRSVYFGSKFYEDSGSVSGSWDDFQDWLDGKYDDLWDKLKDAIPEGSTLSEDEIEKLIDKLLDQLKETTGKVEEGNQQTNSLLEKILNALDKLDATVSSAFSGSVPDTSGIEEYLAAILDDLDYMVYKMEESSEEEFQQKTNDMLDEVQMTFSDLGEIAKKKFPLSIPWDMDALLSFLGGKNAPEAVVLDSFESDDFIIIDTSYNDGTMLFTGEPGDGGSDDSHGGHGGSDHDVRLSVYLADVISSSGVFMSSDGDPVFSLPFLVSESLGIKGTVYIMMSRFKIVSQIGRTLFTCTFIMYLIHLTFKVVSLGKDVFE